MQKLEIMHQKLEIRTELASSTKLNQKSDGQARALLLGFDNTEYFNMCEFYSAEDNNTNARIAQVIEDVRESESTISVYPNPNTGAFKVVLPVSEDELSIEIISSMGGLMKQLKHKSVEGDNILEVQDLPAGLYFVVVKQNGITIGTNKVIVTK